MRYIFRDCVRDIVERTEVIEGHREGDRGVLTERSTGWWIVIGNLAYNVGNEKPVLETGDVVEITIEKKIPPGD